MPPEGVDRVDYGAVVPGGRGQHGTPMGERDVPHLICVILQHLQGAGKGSVADSARLTGAESVVARQHDGHVQTAKWTEDH